MRTTAKLASPLTWRQAKGVALPAYYLLTDVRRLADPLPVLHRLPRGAAVILRHFDKNELERLARLVIPRAQRLGLKVLLSSDIRLALKLKADGVHLSEHQARLGPLRTQPHKPGFLLTVAAHSHLALWRAGKSSANAVLVSPIFATQSHPGAKALGVLRALALMNSSPVQTIALGGLTSDTAKRLKSEQLCGLAAIGGW